MLPSLALPAPPSPETIAFLSAVSDAESDFQSDVLTARRYDCGQQFVALTDRLRAFLGGNTLNTADDFKRLRLNVCHIVLSAVVDRLIVSGFDSDEVMQEQPDVDERGQPTTKTVKQAADWAGKLWQVNRMDAKQRRVHEMALRDSEAFVIVDWDGTKARPRFTPHQRFVDGTVDGDGDGCQAYYRNEDPDQDLLFVTKRWTEVWFDVGGGRRTRQRLTVYFPDRIQKYAGFPGAWAPTVDDDSEPWPIPWLDKAGAPLGIPVAHFRSSAGMEAREAWPLQNAINKLMVDLMTESDMAAFRIMLAFGWTPVDDAGNPLTIEPGRWLGSPSKDATAMAIPGSDLGQFLNVIDSLILKVASTTDTPVARFIVSKQISAEGSQKQGDAPLINKARARQSEMGDGWETAFSIAVRLENTYGVGGLDELAQLSTLWEPLEARDEAADTAKAEAWLRMGIPISIVAPILGLTPQQTDLWQQEKDKRTEIAAAISQQAPPSEQQGAQADGSTQTGQGV